MIHYEGEYRTCDDVFMRENMNQYEVLQTLIGIPLTSSFVKNIRKISIIFFFEGLCV